MMNKLNKVLEIVNSDMLMEMVSEVNSWDSSLDWLDYIDMENLDDILYGLTPTEILNKIYYGDFNPNDQYFRFDGYENLKSCSVWEVEEELDSYKEEIVERFIESYEDGHVETTYQEILDILDDDIEEK